jgi:hypothetical protein
MNTARAVRTVLRVGPLSPKELNRALPDHNPYTISNALQNMLRFGAVKKVGNAYHMALGLETEADYHALLQEFRAVRAPIVAEADGEPGPYIPALRSDPISVALRSRW